TGLANRNYQPDTNVPEPKKLNTTEEKPVEKASEMYENQTYRSGEEWNDFLKEKYGNEKIAWETKDANTFAKTIKDVEARIIPEAYERNVLNSFAGGKATPVTYEGGRGIVLYRVGRNLGPYWSMDVPPATEYQWRVDCAIKQEFFNDGSKLYKITIPQGASLSGIEGKVGSQGMGLYGGSHQVYIDHRAIPEDWIETSKMLWK
ncbi:MAG: hypothetical protein K5654_07540, partial [Lachnospiraceae bacterium]|nr:hypothetical protein [Lachnospiraceae bacterium]